MAKKILKFRSITNITKRKKVLILSLNVLQNTTKIFSIYPLERKMVDKAKRIFESALKTTRMTHLKLLLLADTVQLQTN